MALNTADDAIIADRRARVAALRLRGLTQRAIVDALTAAGCQNPDTHEPWSLGIINKDVQALTTQWRNEGKAATATLRGTQLAELRELRRVAWAQGGSEGNAVVAALVAALKDPEESVRREAARSLGQVVAPDGALILKGLDLEAELTGTKAPAGLDLTTKGQPLPAITEIVVHLAHADEPVDD